MGGQQCHGAVVPEDNEPIFHADWEKRALALTVAMGFTGTWNIDASRHARETIPPSNYLTFSYYEIWIAGLQKLIISNGLASLDEIEIGVIATPSIATNRVLTGSETSAALAAGGPADRENTTQPSYGVGEQVRTLNINPESHTRLPRYARKAVGTIDFVQGFHVFPDTNAAGKGECPQWLYSVRFSATELFGAKADPNHEILIDCWEPYLERT